MPKEKDKGSGTASTAKRDLASDESKMEESTKSTSVYLVLLSDGQTGHPRTMKRFAHHLVLLDPDNTQAKDWLEGYRFYLRACQVTQRSWYVFNSTSFSQLENTSLF